MRIERYDIEKLTAFVERESVILKIAVSRTVLGH